MVSKDTSTEKLSRIFQALGPSSLQTHVSYSGLAWTHNTGILSLVIMSPFLATPGLITCQSLVQVLASPMTLEKGSWILGELNKRDRG